MMKVAAGRFKGRRIRLAPGVGTRPSSGRIKEAIFSSLGKRVEGRVIADLFAGSGALGIEALSRGAKKVVFVEIDRRALNAIRANLEILGIGPTEAVVRRADAWRWLERLARGEPVFPEDIEGLLLDPPYAEESLERVLSLAPRLLESSRVRFLALEHPARAEGSPPPGVEMTTRRHGRSAYSILEGART